MLPCLCGAVRPDLFSPFAPQSQLYLDVGRFPDVKIPERHASHTAPWDSFAIGLLGAVARNTANLDEEGAWEIEPTAIGFDINSAQLSIRLPEAKVSGDRVVFGQLPQRSQPRDLEVETLQQNRCHIGHFETPNGFGISSPGQSIYFYCAPKKMMCGRIARSTKN